MGRLAARVALPVLALFAGFLATPADAAGPFTIDAEKELLIRDLSVVEDPRAKAMGPWAFGGIIEEIAPADASKNGFTERWLRQWPTVTHLNGFSVEPRRFERYRMLWPAEARAGLELEKAPFRLLSLVYRPDIANEEAPYGEFRLVYSGVRPSDRQGVQFLLIFEFRIPGERGQWAKAFHRLGGLPFGSAYNSELEKLTRRLATRENFLRVRTNDFYADTIWELRQFELDRSGDLVQVPLTNTPDLEFDEGKPREAILFDLLRENETKIIDGTFRFPESFLAGAAWVPGDSFRWLPNSRSRLAPEVGRKISEGTCNGCHGGETRTIFSHIGPRGERSRAPISPYLRRELSLRADRLVELLGPAGGVSGPPVMNNKVH